MQGQEQENWGKTAEFIDLIGFILTTCAKGGINGHGTATGGTDNG